MDKFETHTTIPIDHTDLSDSGNRMEMPIDLYETANHVTLYAAMPRCQPNQIQLGLSDGTLTILAEEKEGEDELDKDRNFHLRELPYGKIGRSISLPTCQHDSGIAHFNNGLLILTFDK